MRWTPAVALGAVCLVIAACGDSGSSTTTFGTAEGGSTTTSTATSSETSSGEATSAETTTGSTSGSTGGNIFDVGEMPDQGASGGECSEGEGGYDFSFIWIANSTEGTVSKINTVTGEEEGRYRTGPLVAPDPSRTSVNLYGDAAAANRNGGVVKIATRTADCVDRNNDAQITTSTGPADIKPWGQDECAIWHIDLPSYGLLGPRPIAWEGGVDPEGCALPNPRLWIGYSTTDTDQGVFHRLDGETGDILDTVTVDNWANSGVGPYGGAVNGDGDFIATGWGNARVVKIDGQTLQVDSYMYPGGHYFYGMALDAEGDVWIAGGSTVYSLDPDTSQWATTPGGGGLRGLAVDTEGIAWIAGNGPCRLVKIDTLTNTVLDSNIPIAGCDVPVGISIDVDGFVWVVDKTAHKAFKVDHVTHQLELTVSGLVDPYTYSDMTGAGLNLVVNPEG